MNEKFIEVYFVGWIKLFVKLRSVTNRTFTFRHSKQQTDIYIFFIKFYINLIIVELKKKLQTIYLYF